MLIKDSQAAPKAAELWVRGWLCHLWVTTGSPSIFSCLLAPCHLYFEMFTKEWENIFFSGNNFCKWLTSLNSPHSRIHIYLNGHLLFIKWNIWSDSLISSILMIFHDLGKERTGIRVPHWDMVFLSCRLWTAKITKMKKILENILKVLILCF